MISQEWKKRILLMVVVLMVGLTIGYNYGVSSTIKGVVHVGRQFVDIDEEMVKAAITTWRDYNYNSIKDCIPQ